MPVSLSDLFIRIAPFVFVGLWATGFVGARLSMPHAEPASFLLLRYLLAFSILGLIALLWKSAWPKGRLALHCMVVGMLVHAVYLGCVFWAVRNGMPANVSAIIVGLQPLLTALIAAPWLGERITSRHWVGISIGLIGILLVLGPKVDVTDSGITAITVSVCLLSVLGMAIGTVCQKRFGGTAELLPATCLQYFGAALPTLAFALAFESFAITWNFDTVIGLLWLVFVLSIAAVFLLMWLIAQGSVARVSSLFYLVPVVAATMTWALFGETLLPVQIVGMVLCAFAVALAAIGKGTTPAPVSKAQP